jgi:hypothetical protein
VVAPGVCFLLARVSNAGPWSAPASAEGVGGWLANDLTRSGSKPGRHNLPDTPRRLISGLLRSPSSASRTPTAFGQNQKQEQPDGPFSKTDPRSLRPESTAIKENRTVCYNPWLSVYVMF